MRTRRPLTFATALACLTTATDAGPRETNLGGGCTALVDVVLRGTFDIFDSGLPRTQTETSLITVGYYLGAVLLGDDCPSVTEINTVLTVLDDQFNVVGLGQMQDFSAGGSGIQASPLVGETFPPGDYFLQVNSTFVFSDGSEALASSTQPLTIKPLEPVRFDGPRVAGSAFEAVLDIVQLPDPFASGAGFSVAIRGPGERSYYVRNNDPMRSYTGALGVWSLAPESDWEITQVGTQPFELASPRGVLPNYVFPVGFAANFPDRCSFEATECGVMEGSGRSLDSIPILLAPGDEMLVTIRQVAPFWAPEDTLNMLYLNLDGAWSDGVPEMVEHYTLQRLDFNTNYGPLFGCQSDVQRPFPQIAADSFSNAIATSLNGEVVEQIISEQSFESTQFNPFGSTVDFGFGPNRIARVTRDLTFDPPIDIREGFPFRWVFQAEFLGDQFDAAPVVNRFANKLEDQVSLAMDYGSIEVEIDALPPGAPNGSPDAEVKSLLGFSANGFLESSRVALGVNTDLPVVEPFDFGVVSYDLLGAAYFRAITASFDERALASANDDPVLVDRIELTAEFSVVIRPYNENPPEPACVPDINTKNVNPGEPGYGSPDGEVDGADLSYFVENWLGQNAAVADINTKNVNPGEPGYGSPDGEVDGADLSYFVEQWLAGCP